MKTYILTFILALLFQGLKAQKIEKYTGTTTINNIEQKYQGSFDIKFNSFSDKDTLRLYIQGGTVINSLTSQNKPIPYTVTDEELVYKSRKKQILIPTQNIVEKAIEISYVNGFNEIKNERFQFRPDWLEFNIYIDWFPWNIEYGLFHYDIKINASDSIIAYNLSENNRIRSTKETFDIPFTVSSKAQKKVTKNNVIEVYALEVADTITDTIIYKSQEYFSYFENTFGIVDSDKLFIVLSDSKRSLAYARPNYISLAFDQKLTKTDFKTLAHEIAHLWWLKADLSTWDDWLNEAFAEYSSLLMYRKDFGKEALAKYIQKYGDWIKSLNAPPVWGIKKNDSNNNAVVTYKGALRLLDLENRIGIDKMEALLKQMHNQQILTTDDFLNLLEKLSDKETSLWFEEQLKR